MFKNPFQASRSEEIITMVVNKTLDSQQQNLTLNLHTLGSEISGFLTSASKRLEDGFARPFCRLARSLSILVAARRGIIYEISIKEIGI